MVVWLRKYVTISVLREVKELLEKEKKGRDWSQFLLELYREAKASRARMAFEELRRLLDEEDLEEIARSSREFREGFKLR
jgi:predicted CopG family antitoxin